MKTNFTILPYISLVFPVHPTFIANILSHLSQFRSSDGFKLGQLSEIWIEKETGRQLYVFADGGRMEMDWPSSEDTPVNYEKVLSFPIEFAESTSEDHLH